MLQRTFANAHMCEVDADRQTKSAVIKLLLLFLSFTLNSVLQSNMTEVGKFYKFEVIS